MALYTFMLADIRTGFTLDVGLIGKSVLQAGVHAPTINLDVIRTGSPSVVEQVLRMDTRGTLVFRVSGYNPVGPEKWVPTCFHMLRFNVVGETVVIVSPGWSFPLNLP